MQTAIGRDELVPLDDRDEGFYLVVSDLVSLIDRVQTSVKLIETVQATHAQQAICDPELPDVIVLDDVTPLYAKAGAALDACNVSLSSALRFLIESTAPAPHG
jgi:hypothetical protein